MPEILPGVHVIDGVAMPGPTGGKKVNITLLAEENRLTLVDAGPPGAATPVNAYLRSLGYEPQAVRRIIITHHHVDHTGGLAELVAATGAEVWVHQQDAPYVSGSLPRPPIPADLQANDFLSQLPPEQAQALREQMQAFRHPQPVPVDVELVGGERLGLLGGCEILFTPGHTLATSAFTCRNYPFSSRATSCDTRMGASAGHLLALRQTPRRGWNPSAGSPASLSTGFTVTTAITCPPGWHPGWQNWQSRHDICHFPGSVVAADRPSGTPRISGVARTSTTAIPTLLAFTHSFPLLLLAGIIYAAGFGSAQPAIMAWCVDRARASGWGAAVGTFFAAFDGGIGLGALVMGPLDQRFSYQMVFSLATALTLVGFIVFLAGWYYRFTSGRQNNTV